VTIVPCNHCRLSADCDIKRAKVKAVRGAGLTKIQFPCKKRREDLPPGMKVVAKLRYVWTREFDEGGSPEQVEGELHGVVIRWNHGAQRPLVYFPMQDGGALWSFKQNQEIRKANIWPEMLTPTGEVIPVCEECRFPAPTVQELVASKLTGQDIPGREYCEKCNPNAPYDPPF
jgi:hypothetical protein